MSGSLESWHSQGHFFNYRDHRIFWREAGDGPALILLHGFPTGSYDWSRIWGQLASCRRVLALDFLGYGFSDKPARYSYTVADHADQVEALVQLAGVDSYSLLAHDYGDTVAQELLARSLERGPDAHPRPRDVCLLNGGIFPGIHRPTLILKLLNSPLGFAFSALMTEKVFGRRLAEVFGPETRPTLQEVHDFWLLVQNNRGRRIYHRLIRYMDERWRHKDRWVGALVNSPAPLRLINGAADPISGQHLADHYLKIIPDPDVVCLPGIGHYPQWEAPEAVLEHFLAAT